MRWVPDLLLLRLAIDLQHLGPLVCDHSVKLRATRSVEYPITVLPGAQFALLLLCEHTVTRQLMLQHLDFTSFLRSKFVETWIRKGGCVHALFLLRFGCGFSCRLALALAPHLLFSRLLSKTYTRYLQVLGTWVSVHARCRSEIFLFDGILDPSTQFGHLLADLVCR